MVRHWFYAVSAAVLALLALIAFFWPPILWLLLAVGPLIAVGAHDSLQRQHAILRNFPLLGRLRFFFEMVRPEIQQYFIESNVDAYPIEREMRSIVYQRAKGELETKPFGTQRDVYRVGYEWAAHSLAPVDSQPREPRVRIGGPDCAKPYSASLLNISAMSFGALSRTAVRALNAGARKGGFAHNTGEGGLSEHHLAPGGDLVWQIGTGYFGCRTADGGFDPERFRDESARQQVRMIEIKLSQGAKPAHGGILPAHKVTLEIATIRGVPVGQSVISPPAHSAFSTPVGLLEFVAKLRDLSGGKPVGFKLCVGRQGEVFAICKAMLETNITPDFITVDGGEGGTGAAPLEFSNSVGMPAKDAWAFVNNALRGAGLRSRVRLIASGKIITGFHMIRAMALGADVCNSARGMMLALGCIQALRCNANTCPTGVTTQDPALFKALDVADKGERVYRYHAATVHSCLELLGAMGLEGPDQVRPDLLFRRVDDMHVRSFAELFPALEEGQFLDGAGVPPDLRQAWQAASATTFV